MSVKMLALIVLIASNSVYAETLEQRVELLEKRLDALEHLTNKPSKLKAKSAEVGTGGWKNKANWRSLKSGMKDSQVRDLLGEPEKIVNNQYFIYWYYNYPSGGRVEFDPASMQVNAWSE